MVTNGDDSGTKGALVRVSELYSVSWRTEDAASMSTSFPTSWVLPLMPREEGEFDRRDCPPPKGGAAELDGSIVLHMLHGLKKISFVSSVFVWNVFFFRDAMCIVGAKASEGLHRWSKEAANVDAVTALTTFIFVAVCGLVRYGRWVLVVISSWRLQNYILMLMGDCTYHTIRVTKYIKNVTKYRTMCLSLYTVYVVAIP